MSDAAMVREGGEMVREGGEIVLDRNDLMAPDEGSGRRRGPQPLRMLQPEGRGARLRACACSGACSWPRGFVGGYRYYFR